MQPCSFQLKVGPVNARAVLGLNCLECSREDVSDRQDLGELLPVWKNKAELVSVLMLADIPKSI